MPGSRPGLQARKACVGPHQHVRGVGHDAGVWVEAGVHLGTQPHRDESASPPTSRARTSPRARRRPACATARATAAVSSRFDRVGERVPAPATRRRRSRRDRHAVAADLAAARCRPARDGGGAGSARNRRSSRVACRRRAGRRPGTRCSASHGRSSSDGRPAPVPRPAWRVIERNAAFDQREEFVARTRPPHATPRDDRRTLGGAQDRGGAVDQVGFGPRPGGSVIEHGRNLDGRVGDASSGSCRSPLRGTRARECRWSPPCQRVVRRIPGCGRGAAPAAPTCTRVAPLRAGQALRPRRCQAPGSSRHQRSRASGCAARARSRCP